MSLSHPVLLVVGLVMAAGLSVGVVLLGRRRSAALRAAGVALVGGRHRPLGLLFSLAGVVVLAFAMAGPVASVPVRSE